ncbi:nucleotidyltransferase domain-containing protein [uncultured Clostridium sp.]|jgi:predicted nucleotidyltransferase|uniref:type VII toxin-antitoxin system MntA family adenylyltransferase antitoxin n=1 Tax=uncultured Clostridium sp. TaxID=59620 RepID=UPI002625435B|nr:nucleotidyltransferase domain-containing protein [uncultured Clostridium sp.]
MNFNEKLEIGIELIKEFNVCTIYLFGSFSRGEERVDSDIDIAFLSDDNVDEYRCFMKAQELADIFKRDVDLIDLRKVTTVFKAQIIGSAKVIYCNDDSKRAYFEIRSLKEYALLNEERYEILERVKESGRVYGERCSL